MYRQIDEEIILKNLDKLETDAKTIYMKTYEPTIDEMNSVYEDIKKFIINKKRIVYGGYAQNALIKEKNKNDVFYKETDMADIEFYSPDPVGDTIDLCDYLHKKNYKYIEGKEGVHNETYKIFVNFNNYCDISYMPPDLFDKCPTLIAEGMLMTHPHFMLIDAYRVYNDPMTSYFRLRKTFTRFNTLMKYYPLDDKMAYNITKFNINMSKKENENILRFIRKHIIHNSKLIVVGNYAYNQLMKLAGAPDNYMIETTYYTIISDDLDNDIMKIYKKLKQKYPKVNYKRYYPFFQFMDRSFEFYIGDTMILRLYGNNHRCTVYRYSEQKRTYFGSYQLLFMYNLIHYIMGMMRNNDFNMNMYGSMLIRMMKMRDKFLDKNHINVLDKSIFQEFTFQCIGTPVDILRESFLENIRKREKGKHKFLYKPKESAGKKPNFTFNNSSGDLIKK